VDNPSIAVREADLLVGEVMSARGYPVEDFDQRANDLSVRYPEGTQRYREARRIAQANEDGTLRCAVNRSGLPVEHGLPDAGPRRRPTIDSQDEDQPL
jgi:hypothetical protein